MVHEFFDPKTVGNKTPPATYIRKPKEYRSFKRTLTERCNQRLAGT